MSNWKKFLERKIQTFKAFRERWKPKDIIKDVEEAITSVISWN